MTVRHGAYGKKFARAGAYGLPRGSEHSNGSSESAHVSSGKAYASYGGGRHTPVDAYRDTPPSRQTRNGGGRHTPVDAYRDTPPSRRTRNGGGRHTPVDAYRDTPPSRSYNAVAVRKTHAGDDAFPWDGYRMNMTQGMSNHFVRSLQRVLCSIGYANWLAPGYDDGIFGRQTSRAVMHFQRSAGLHPDGIVGIKTSYALKQRCAKGGISPNAAANSPCRKRPSQTRGYAGPGKAPGVPAPRGFSFEGYILRFKNTGAKVHALHKVLCALMNLDQLDLSAREGDRYDYRKRYFGKATHRAVVNFQKLARLAGYYSGRIDGIVGRKTCKALREACRRAGMTPGQCELKRCPTGNRTASGIGPARGPGGGPSVKPARRRRKSRFGKRRNRSTKNRAYNCM